MAKYGSKQFCRPCCALCDKEVCTSRGQHTSVWSHSQCLWSTCLAERIWRRSLWRTSTAAAAGADADGTGQLFRYCCCLPAILVTRMSLRHLSTWVAFIARSKAKASASASFSDFAVVWASHPGHLDATLMSPRHLSTWVAVIACSKAKTQPDL